MTRFARAYVVAMLIPSLAMAQAGEMGSTICCETDACDLPAEGDPVERLDASDAELNRTYAAVLARYRDMPDAIAAIRKAQRTWIALRDQDLEATRLSWRGSVDVDDPELRNSRLFADIRLGWNLARAHYLCSNYLEERG